MVTYEKRLRKLERKLVKVEQPRLLVLEPGETKEDALARMGVSMETIKIEQQKGRRVIWIRWAN